MFIHKEKFQKLFDASANGDEKAKAILDAFMNDGEGCSEMIDEYFRPIPAPEAKNEATIEIKSEDPERAKMSGLEKFLSDNQIKEGDDDYEEFVNSYYDMFPDQRNPEPEPASTPAPEVKEEEESGSTDLESFIKEELDGVGKYDKLIIEFTTMPGLSEAVRSGIVGKIQKIKEDELAHISVLRDIANTIAKKGE